MDEIQERICYYDRIFRNYKDKVISNYEYHDTFPSYKELYVETVDKMIEYEFNLDFTKEDFGVPSYQKMLYASTGIGNLWVDLDKYYAIAEEHEVRSEHQMPDILFLEHPYFAKELQMARNFEIDGGRNETDYYNDIEENISMAVNYEFAICSLLMNYSEAHSYTYYPIQTPLIRELSQKLGYRVPKQIQTCNEILRYYFYNYSLETLSSLYVSKILSEEDKSMVWDLIKFRSKDTISRFRQELIEVTAQTDYYFKYCLDEEEKQEHGFTEEETKTLFKKPVFKYSERRQLLGH